MPKDSNIHSISIKASTENLSAVRNFAAKYAAAFGFSKKQVANIKLAVDEAFTNIIKHAYKDDTRQTVQIKLGYHNQEFWVSLSDTGIPFNPTTYSDPNIPQSIQSGAPGGLGVSLIRKLMDKIQYRAEGASNTIFMTKKSKF